MASAIFTQKVSAFLLYKEDFMLTSIAIILISGLFLSFIFTKIRLPGLLGMILAEILLGPHALNLIDFCDRNVI